MRSALGEARKALGETSPNPVVGALLVTNKRIIARGHHRQAGCHSDAMDAAPRPVGHVVAEAGTQFVEGPVQSGPEHLIPRRGTVRAEPRRRRELEQVREHLVLK